MANTVEYAILSVVGLTQKNTQIDRIEITRDEFILYDSNGSLMHKARRMPGGVNIVSEYIPDLSFGTILRFVVSDLLLFSVSDEEGEMKIECEVTIPEED